MTIYFVVTGNKEEIEVIRELKPTHILVSFWYFKGKSLVDFCDNLGYNPTILLDSGAYSALTRKKSVNILDYMKYITKNAEVISEYVSLDVIDDSELTVAFYDIMLAKGFNPIPVYHYGEESKVIEHYISKGTTKIALGGTVPIRDKTIVSDWCSDLGSKYPEIEFHLLGSSSKVVLGNPNIASCDSSSWYMMAVNGFPKEIVGKTKTAKIERAKYQMRKLMGLSS